MKIVKWPSSVLKQKSANVDVLLLPGTHDELINKMVTLMKDNDGVGLSAIQVGIPLNIVVTAFTECPILINPVILHASKNRIKSLEGCLSLPRVYEEVSRPESLTVEFFDQQYVKQRMTLAGVTAQCVSHEIDHLNGIFFLDYANSARRDKIRALIRQGKL